MSITLSTLSSDISVGALVTITFDTAKNTSEGGISGRKAMRTQAIRKYMLSTLPGDDSEEFQELVLSLLGHRYPFAMRDWTSYTFTDELLEWTVNGSLTTTTARLRKLFQPASGSLYYYQRILVPDLSEVGLTITLNDAPLPSGVYATIVDPGIISLNTALVSGDRLKASGQYLIPVCLVDDPSATIVAGNSNGEVLYTFKNVRLEEILEDELTTYL